MRSNIPCYLKDVSCGKPCEKNLSCGVHRCPRICHPGECIAEGEECRQPCSVMREACGHSCGLPCHGKTDCPQSSCASQVQVSCGCGRKSAKMCCSEVDKTNAKAQAARAIDAKASNGSVVILERQDSADRYKCLPCDSECSRAQRNRKLAMALELDRDDDNACPTPGEPTYTDFLRTQAKTNPPLVLDVENALIQLVQSTESQRTNTTRNHVFRPMVADMRRLIHEYAAYFRVETLSYDPEPQRNVVASAKRGQSFVPNTLLSSFIPKTVPKIAPPPQKSAWGTTSETKEKFASSAIPAEGMQTLTSATTVVRRLPPVD
uniref:R3H domain-containing protein n=1 Tax=Plectus sambesii TaxID=2011161 RepID=A0A914WH11_9BILA